MEKLIAQYGPERVVCLGDSFHDAQALARLGQEEKHSLEKMVSKIPRWFWVEGNHDSSMKTIGGISSLSRLEHGPFIFSHQFLYRKNGHIIGHFHPEIRLKTGNQKIKEKCFLMDENTHHARIRKLYRRSGVS